MHHGPGKIHGDNTLRTAPDCLACFLRQTLESARLATADTVAHERLMHLALGALAGLDLAQSPPAAVQTIQRLLRRATGVADPYHEAKRRFTVLALGLLPGLQHQIRQAADPFGAAVRLAIAGNVIDLGAKSGLGEGEASAAISRALAEPLVGDLEKFRQAVAGAARILYLTDNAGEIVLDRLLIGQLPPGRVTLAVRGAPVLNDATREDAEAAGLSALAEIVDNGSDAPGTLLADCSPDFQQRFRAADVIVAKGQGNFESLADAAPGVFFLFRVKCAAVAAQIGQPVGAQVLWRSPKTRRGQQDVSIAVAPPVFATCVLP